MPALISTWGPSCWHMLHSVGFTYEEHALPAHRAAMYRFLISLGDVLPCKLCRVHYADHIAAHVRGPHSPVLASRGSLSVYLVQLHNDVNARLGKRLVPYAEVEARYTRADRAPGWPAVGAVAALCLLLVALVVVLRRMRAQ